jgi:MFS transporter, DHA2 family, methylenomycin A resistance protein
MSDYKVRFAFSALGMGFFMVILDVTIVNVALPTIAYYFHTNVTGLQWIVDGYTLVFAGLLLLVGAVCDYFGAKRIFQTGLIAFGLTSLGCALSPSIAWLIFFRLLQGAAGALLLPSSLALITHLYAEAKDRAHAIGVWAALGGIACASGPFLGGTLTGLFSWRVIFFINLLIGLASFLLVHLYFNSGKESRPDRKKFDFLGQISGFLFIFLLSYGLIEAGVHGWLNPLILFCLTLSGLSLTFFLWIENRVSNAMLPLALFSNRVTAMALIAALVLNLSFYGELFMIPFYFQNLRHYSVFKTGLAILPLPGLALMGSYWSGRLIAKIGSTKIIVTGFIIAAAGFFALLTLEQATPHYIWIMLPFLVIGFGVSFATPAMTFAAIHSITPKYSGVAAAILNTVSQVGSLIGVAIFGTIIAMSRNFMLAMHTTLLLAGIMFLMTALLHLIAIQKRIFHA